jgi:DNA-binding NarL/FixJ family response regulator
MRPLRLLIADDHALMIEAVKLAVENEPDFEIVGEAESGSQVLPLVQRTSPDLVVLDLVMPGIDGLTCIRLLRERFADVKIAVLSGLDSDETVESALRLGAACVLWLAEQTVKFHLTNIYRKLDVASRTEAVHWAYRHGLLEAPIVRTTSQSD